jgi:hypothetical protein
MPDTAWTPDGRRRIYGAVVEEEFDIEEWEKKMEATDDTVRDSGT